MPDPLRQTISATESPGLFHVSPYVTRWMLYQKFAHGVDIDQAADSRMSWGTKMQPLLLAQAAADLRLEVKPNDETYHRRGQLGATRDATIICPDRGPGALETKCVFDYGVWMRDWGGGKSPPRHYEIQLQQQMLVGDSHDEGYRWGVLAAWVCGEMHYFERQPIPELWRELGEAAARFFDDVANKREPNAFGDPIELPLMTELFKTASGRVLDMREDESAQALVQDAADLQSNGAARGIHEKEYKRLRAKFMALMDGADELLLPGGASIKVTRSARAGYSVNPTTTVTLKPYIPQRASL
jgi:hypothetical protein